ncbi:PREDICTED: odorant receptor 47b-like [Trachymyrmex septentrionalis]|uniref:odorant receptor 47b-like n=1 Tax=Trachymyrmex septentrionalis TaxID=34720 RepID=UPI00084ED99C|nr:PREDICTED: odorant receptor 47b-like [Trachymyrmex septentrionalis]
MLESKQLLTFSNLIYFVVVLDLFSHMCIYCAVGEVLTTQYDKIHYAVYFNEWYTLNAKNTRDLVLLMLRTSKPLYLNFGKLFPLTMGTFCSLLKTSAGYISVLLTTRSQ